MAFKVKTVTSGFKPTLDALAQLSLNIDEIAAQALQAGAEVMQEGMLKRVPVDTGNLRDHIKINGPENVEGMISCEVGVLDADAETARYANVQEHGTASMRAHSFIRATMDEDKKKIRKAIRDTFKLYLPKKAKKKSKKGE